MVLGPSFTAVACKVGRPRMVLAGVEVQWGLQAPAALKFQQGLVGAQLLLSSSSALAIPGLEPVGPPARPRSFGTYGKLDRVVQSTYGRTGKSSSLNQNTAEQVSVLSLNPRGRKYIYAQICRYMHIYIYLS